jgi:hypothetical protein
MASRLKKNILAVALVISLCGLFVIFWKQFNAQNVTSDSDQSEKSLQLKEFNQKLIPLYLQKIAVLKKYFKTEKDQGEMVHYFKVSKNWNAKDTSDMEMIVELAGYLDQKIVKAASDLEEKKKSSLFKELEPIEREIRQIDRQILDRIINKKN